MKIVKLLYHYLLPSKFRAKIRKKYKFKENEIQNKWRKQNSHNNTSLGICDELFLNNISVGNYTYGIINVHSYDNQMSKISIGHCCSIASNVTFFMNEQHYTNRISTFPFKRFCQGNSEGESFSKGDIIVEDDVWIGEGVTVLSGVKIGKGAVIGTGAVVACDISPYSICGGVPAKVIRKRFDDELIEELLKLDYSKLTIDMVNEHIQDLYNPIASTSQLEWFPRNKSEEDV